MYIEPVAIRSASVSWQQYQEYCRIQDPKTAIEYTLSNPILRTTLENVNKVVYERLEQILNGSLSLTSKKGKKSLRYLSTIVARAATRSTPSRLLGRIGNVSLDINDPKSTDNILLDEVWTLFLTTENKKRTSSKTQLGFHDKIRWNPSVIKAGNIFYLTSPRKLNNPPYSTLNLNKAVNIIYNKTKHAIMFSDLIDILNKEYPEVNSDRIIDSINNLYEHEFILNQDDKSFYCRNDDCLTERFTFPECKQDDLYKRQLNFKSGEIESSKNASIYFSETTQQDICSGFNRLLDLGLCPTSDQGIAQTFAKYVNERYGECYVPLSELIKPGTGITYEKVMTGLQINSSPESEWNLSILASSQEKWVDLKHLDMRLFKKVNNWRYPNSCSIPLSVYSRSNLEKEPIFLAADGIVGMPSNTLGARFISNTNVEEVAPFANSSSIENGIQVGLDWTSPNSETNNIRERFSGKELNLNVNAFTTIGKEITIDDILLISNGEELLITDRSYNKLQILPQSMVNPSLLPDWLFLIMMSSVARWPTMSFSWNQLDKEHQSLPGIRFGNLIFSRPLYRYTGIKEIEEFQQWCDDNCISEWIRLGDHDRKILINRTSKLFYGVIERYISKGNMWVEDASIEASNPFAHIRNTDENYHSEVVFRLSFDHRAQHGSYIKNVRSVTKPVVTPHDDAYIIPGVSDLANFELVPCNGDINRILHWIGRGFPQYSYFIRYVTDRGLPCLRLRIDRSQLSKKAVQDILTEMYLSGIILDISEKQHRLEYERYGGVNTFYKFKKVAEIESHWITDLAGKGLLQKLSNKDKIFYAIRWLRLIPNASNLLHYNLDSERFNELLNHRQDSVKEKDEIIKEWIYIEPEIKRIFNTIKANEEVWLVALHLFCNRMGLAPEDEISIWNIIKKDAGVLKE